MLNLCNGINPSREGRIQFLKFPSRVVAAKDCSKEIACLVIMKGAAMKTKEGDKYKNAVDGVEYVLRKIVDRMALLESQDGKRQILTEVDNLRIASFYKKMELNET